MKYKEKTILKKIEIAPNPNKSMPLTSVVQSKVASDVQNSRYAVYLENYGPKRFIVSEEKFLILDIVGNKTHFELRKNVENEIL